MVADTSLSGARVVRELDAVIGRRGRRISCLSDKGGELTNPAIPGPVALIMILIVSALVLPPLVVILQGSLAEANPDGSAGAFTLRHFTRLFADPLLYSSTWHSVVFAAAATVVTLVVGGSIAWLVERTNTPLRWPAYVTTIVSMGTPYLTLRHGLAIPGR